MLPYVSAFLVGDCMQMILTGVITGAGKQGASGPILVVGYWILGLPFGAACAFTWPWNDEHSLGLLGLWLGMTLAVSVHVGSYLLICFGGRRVPFAIKWGAAINEAQQRLALEAQPASAARDHAAHVVDPLPLVIAAPSASPSVPHTVSVN